MFILFSPQHQTWVVFSGKIYISVTTQVQKFRVRDRGGIEDPILSNEFKDVYVQARRTRAAVGGFINYFKKYEERKATNREPLNREPDNLSSYIQANSEREKL
jgi:hypothetical protein